MDQAHVDTVVQTAAKVIASGAIGTNGHGNISVRAHGEDEMYFTSAPTSTGYDPRRSRGWVSTASSGRATSLPSRGSRGNARRPLSQQARSPVCHPHPLAVCRSVLTSEGSALLLANHGCSSTTAPPTWPERRPTPSPSGARSRSQRRCGRRPCSGPWPSTPPVPRSPSPLPLTARSKNRQQVRKDGPGPCPGFEATPIPRTALTRCVSAAILTAR